MDSGEFYEGVVKQQLLSTLAAYLNDDGTVDMDGWLADTCLALDFSRPGRDWKHWAYEVIGAAEVQRLEAR